MLLYIMSSQETTTEQNQNKLVSQNPSLPRSCGGSQTPRSPPPPPVGPPYNSKHEMGKDGRAKEMGGGGPGWVRVGRPRFPILSLNSNMQHAKDRKKNAKTHPPPTQETRGTKRSKGQPTNPEEEKRHETRKKTRKKSTKIGDAPEQFKSRYV